MREDREEMREERRGKGRDGGSRGRYEVWGMREFILGSGKMMRILRLRVRIRIPNTVFTKYCVKTLFWLGGANIFLLVAGAIIRCHVFTLSRCHVVTLSCCHIVTLSLCRVVALLRCHVVTLRIVTLSRCRVVACCSPSSDNSCCYFVEGKTIF